MQKESLFDSQAFINGYTYDGDDLGAVIHGDITSFKLWAPTANRVILNLFPGGHDCGACRQVDMTKGGQGVWFCVAENCGHGTYYTYTVTTVSGTHETGDPYAKAAGVNGRRSMVVDLEKTNPPGWDRDKPVALASYTDAVIWEIHVRDFSSRISASRYPGKYLAFTERGLTNGAGIPVGVDYLIRLGITHVQLMPVFDYASVDERASEGQYNWGYDPQSYNVPEGSYATDPYRGEVRIREFKAMVQSLHEAGIGVIMDVVYNHTYDRNSTFQRTVPGYYYRGSNASGCGNDTASERKMFRRFMVDSVCYWAKEYHLDGFRFDLMGLHDLETMAQIEAAVHAINPSAILYGEGWTMGQTLDGSPQANQQNIARIPVSQGAAGGMAVFNDVIRDGLKGSTFQEADRGYISGNDRQTAEAVRFGIRGGRGEGFGWEVENGAVINYMSVHDNHTLWDKLALSNPEDTIQKRLAMNRLGAAIVMIARGTPFMQAGEEMLRTKGGDPNSYRSGDAVNSLDWEKLTASSDAYAMMCYYKGLMELRSAHAIFRSRTGRIAVDDLDGGMLVRFEDTAEGSAMVLINPAEDPITCRLKGQWKLLATGTRAGREVHATESGCVSVDARSVRIYIR